MLKEHPTFWILDSTKIQQYQQCPRSYFFKFILGWSGELPNVHLQYGIALHLALEHLLLNGYEKETVAEAFEIFNASFQETYVSICGDEHPRKNVADLYYSLSQYAELYKNDLKHFNVMHTEVAGSILIDVEKKLYFRLDTICAGNYDNLHGFFSMEHKSGTTWNAKWDSQWIQKTQVGTYLHVVNCLYPQDKVLGVAINGFFPHSMPKLKANGELYANSKDAEFRRLLIRKTPIQMEDWILTTLSWYDDIVKDTEAVMKVQDEPVMNCFRKRPEECNNYFGCEYVDYCRAWTNPVLRGASPQTGFVEKFWDPRQLIEKAKKEVEL